MTKGQKSVRIEKKKSKNKRVFRIRRFLHYDRVQTCKPEEWEDCIKLANYVFSTAHRPHDFEQLIPRVYQAGPEMARIHRVAVAENGRLRAEIAVLPQQMAAGGKLLRAGYVGSVSVHPKARGEGHMKRLLGDWITDLEGTCDLLALDGQRQRYAYFGFTPGICRN